jgi:phospholipid/cholesterol/gamma-HCH transport system substrate-binding protein
VKADRSVRVLTGLVAIVLFTGIAYFGVKWSNGDLRSVYYINASFDTAGQGLEAKSDVKIHGVTIGQVRKVTLRGDRALVRLEIKSGQRVPAQSRAVVQPKTLFGEKFVNIIPAGATEESQGPFVPHGGTITNTVGGFELGDVLAAAYPLLKDLHPEDLTVTLDTLAQAGAGEGQAINHQIGNFEQLANLGVAHNRDTRVFLDDFALLTQELANDSGSLVSLAQDLNAVLPPLDQRGDELTSTLNSLSRLSNDVADVLDANRTFQDKAVLEGSKPLTVLTDNAATIGTTITFERVYFQTLTQLVHIPLSDGQMAAAIKLVLGGGCPNGQVNPCPTPVVGSLGGPPASATASTPQAGAPATNLPLPNINNILAQLGGQRQSGVNAILNLLTGGLG